MNNNAHMSQLGVGPTYVGIIILLTNIAIDIGETKLFLIGKIELFKAPLLVIGIGLVIIGFILWVQAVIVSRINENIAQNKLVITGVYAWVRNPIYSAFFLGCTGFLCIQNNILLLIFPIIYWLFLSIIVRKEERILEQMFEKEYLQYKSRVNRCIPWFPKNNKI